ncbi:hypothetical protein HS961_10775 [Comamonas piscis]|uniref:Uncharacterized protein n=1 Tax=Comamonas piscis TaxID=1562974 RepID=A0A7G5EGZ6_9BURK|nr:hypothetical protein [Comamonas piscis]QMV73271.1 hypothetical protein HS961_10775 [Comamonas piscis]WSO36069.1 hypothetical protein VUJ63_10810 [Comamonas piscis]
MSSLLLRIDPRLLKNPDLDLRTQLVDRLSERSNGYITEDGYDYEDDTDAMLIFLCTGGLPTASHLVVHVLEHEEILGNCLAGASTLGLSTTEDAEIASDYLVIYPRDKAGCPMG